jgi:8-amino-7-oxononanoate synthase
MTQHLAEPNVRCSTIVELLRSRADDQPNKIAYTFLSDREGQQSSLTYATLDQRARAIGAWLQRLGAAGERALLLYPPGLDYIAAFFGCLYAGVVAVPAYPPHPNRPALQLQSIAADAQATIALTITASADTIKHQLGHTPALASLRWLNTDVTTSAMAAGWHELTIGANALAFLQYTSGSTSIPRGVMISHGNLLHNLEVIRRAFQIAPNSVGVFWLPMYHDLGLIGGVLSPLYVGEPSLLISPRAFVEQPLRWLQAISRYKGTISGAPNFAYDLCVDRITPAQRATLDLSSWQTAFCGAEPIRPETLERFTEAFAPYGFQPAAFYPCYGLAEATLIVSGGSKSELPIVHTVNSTALQAHTVIAAHPTTAQSRTEGTEELKELTSEAEAPGQLPRSRRSFSSLGAGGEFPPEHTRLVSCGRALFDQQIVIVDPTTCTQCAPDQVGEIWLTGPSVAQGYWGRPEETAQTFHAHTRDTGEGPFLRTGDLGFMNEGELFVTGRIKDLIVIRGRNHYPQDIERTIAQSHPALKTGMGAACSIAVAGEERLVVVHEVDRRYLREEELDAAIGAIRQAIARRHELQAYAICLIKPLQLPRTSSGKVQRHVCAARFLAGSLAAVKEWRAGPAQIAQGDTHALTAPTRTHLPEDAGVLPEQLAAAIAAWLAAEIAQRAKIAPGQIDLDQPFDRYGLDSLEVVTLASALEAKLSRRLPETLLWEHPTLRALAQHLAHEASGARPEAVADTIQRFSLVRLPALASKPRPHPGPASGSFQPQPAGAQLQKGAVSFSAQRLAILNERYQEAQAKGTYFYQPVITSQAGAWVVVEGQRRLMLASYSYLGLIGHPKINQAAQAAIAEFGTGAHGVRLLAGTTFRHRELEQTIADFKHTEDAIVFSSGYVANLATISTFATKGHVVICDKLNHASIVDGCSLSQARFVVFGHNDMADLERCLQQAGGAGTLVVVDAVFSMDGDLIDLPAVARLCKQYGAYLMVDEAHSLGVLGPTGRGIEEHFGLDSATIDIKMGTLSKAIPSVGGYVAGRAELIAALKHNARAFIFSAALPPPQVAAAQAAFEVIRVEPERVASLQRMVKRYLGAVQALGFNTLKSESPIVPLVCTTEQQAFDMTRMCQAEGLLVLPIVYPAVPIHAPRLRTTLTAAHSDADVDFALGVIERCGRRCGLIQ